MIKLPQGLYQHLVNIKVFESQRSPTRSSYIELSATQQVLVENGIAVAKLLKSIHKVTNQRPSTPIIYLDQLKTLNTQAVKLYNWNIIVQSMNSMQIPHEVNGDIKKLILMGDSQIIQDTIIYLYEYYLKLQKRGQSANQRTRIYSESQKQIQHPQLNLNDSQDQIVYNSNILEFFTQLLGKNLNLHQKQVISLYGDNFKYWAQVVSKGVQRAYEPIVSFYREVFLQVEHLQNLILMDREKGLKFSLNLLKPGLLSKSQDVAIETIKCFGKFVINSAQLSIFQDTHKWYIENCFQTTLLSIKRHPELVDSLVDLMLLFCKNNLVELFTETIKKHSANIVEMLMIVEKIFHSLNPEHILEISSIGVMQQWLEFGLEQMEQGIGIDERICILRLICSIWKRQNDRYQMYQSKVHQALRNAIMSDQQPVALFAGLLLMQLIEYLGKEKQSEAPILYKMLSLIIAECKEEIVLNFLLNNVIILFNCIPSIPLSVLLDPLLVVLQEKNYLSLCVFNFLNQIATHPNITVKTQVQLMDLLSKIAIYDILHYKIASGILMQMVSQNIDTNSTQEFIIKFSKISLAVYYSLGKKHTTSKKPSQLTIDNQRKAQIIEVLKSFVQLKNQTVNEYIKMMAGHTNLQFPKQNKGLLSLLAQFGNVNEIMSQVEQEYHQQQSQKQQYSESSIKEVQQVQSSLKKYSKIKLTKDEQYHLARLRMNKEADPRVIEDIDLIKKQYHQKVTEQQNYLNEQKILLETQKQRVRKQLEKRQIEQGVATLNQKDVVVKLIFPDGSRQLELIKEKKIFQFELLDLQLEEDIDRLMVEQLLKKYGKVFRFMFNKYSNSTQRIAQPNSFDERRITVNLADLIKFIRDYEIKFPTENVPQLCRQVGTQILHKRNEFKEFDYNGFQHFVIQLGIVLNNSNISHIQPYVCLQELVNHMRGVAAYRGQSTQLFDEPETQYFQENDIIKEFNQRLLQDPEYELPQSYQKVQTTEISFNYQLTFLQDDERIPYEIVNDILEETFKFHIIEPISFKNQIYKAKPNIFGYISSKINQEQDSDQMYNIVHKQAAQQNKSLLKKRVLEIEPKRQLSLQMKMVIAEYGFRDRTVVEQVANVLDDMIFAIEHNKDNINRQTIVINKAIEDKRQQQLQEQENQQQKEQKRREREKEIKERLTKQKEEYTKRVQSEEQERIQKSKTQHEKQKLEKDEKQRYQSELKQKIMNRQEKLKEEQLRQMLEEKEKNSKDFQIKKQKFKEFNLNQITKLKKLIEEDHKKKDQQNSLRTSKIKKEQQLLQQARSKILTQQDQSRMERDLEKEIKDKYISFEHIFQKYLIPLQALFQFLIKETFHPLGQPTDQIYHKTFTWFTDRFNLSPEIVTIDFVITTYRYVTKDKEIIDGQPIGMKFEDFKFALFRIAIRGCQAFNKVRKEDKKEERKQEQSPQQQDDIVNSQLIETPQRRKSKSFMEPTIKDFYSFYQQTTEQTLEALILYLDISEDKNQLDHRFRKALQEKKVPNKMRKKQLEQKLGAA